MLKGLRLAHALVCKVLWIFPLNHAPHGDLIGTQGPKVPFSGDLLLTENSNNVISTGLITKR